MALYRLFLRAAWVCLIVPVFVSPKQAAADYILVAQPDILRIQEGQIGRLTITATNTSPFDIQVDLFGVDPFFEFGDASDGLTALCCPPSPLPIILSGQSTTYFVNIGTTLPPPNDNFDSGFWGLAILGSAFPVGDLGVFVPTQSTGSVVEVYDVPVPELPSFVLSCTGVLIGAAILLTKLRRTPGGLGNAGSRGARMTHIRQ